MLAKLAALTLGACLIALVPTVPATDSAVALEYIVLPDAYIQEPDLPSYPALEGGYWHYHRAYWHCHGYAIHYHGNGVYHCHGGSWHYHEAYWHYHW